MSVKKKDVPDVMRGMGVGLSIITNLNAELRRRKLPDWLLHPLATPDGESLIARFVDLLQEKEMGERTRGIHNIVVDYNNLTFSEMLGNLDVEQRLQSPGIFRIEGEGRSKNSIYLLAFDKPMFSKDAEAKMIEWGFRSTKVEEHFALLNQNPKLRDCGYPIISLGISRQCRRQDLGNPVLIWRGAETSVKNMGLRVNSPCPRWTKLCYFAAVFQKK